MSIGNNQGYLRTSTNGMIEDRKADMRIFPNVAKWILRNYGGGHKSTRATLHAYPERQLTQPSFSGLARPIFIVGSPRSGTSIMTWVLGQHTNIQPMPETAWIAGMAIGSHLSFAIGSERGAYSHLSNVNYPLMPFEQRIGEAVDQIVHDVFNERCAQRYGVGWREGISSKAWAADHKQMELVRSSSDPKERWVDGTPLNSLFIWGINNMFPYAKYLHMLRPPHEVIASLVQFNKAGGKPQKMDAAIETWIAHTERAFLAQRAYTKSKVMLVDFRRIKDDQEDVLQEICAFLGEQYDANCLAPLGKRINSSKSESTHIKIKERLAKSQRYRYACDLYEKAMEHGSSTTPDEDALARLRDLFVDHCTHSALLWR